MLGPSYQYQATMLRVIDGDTYEVSVDLGFRIYHTIHVRLHDFDTAELRSSNLAEVAHAKAARDFVMKLIPISTKIIISTVKAAVYNRWEADVYYIQDGRQISLAPVLQQLGFAKLQNYPANPGGVA